MPTMPRERYNARRARNCARSGNPVSPERAHLFVAWLQTATDEQLKWHHERAAGHGRVWQKHVVNAEVIRRKGITQ